MDLLSCYDRFVCNCIEGVKQNSQAAFNLSISNIGEIRPARNQTCLPPPPDYYGPQPLDISKPNLLKHNNCYNGTIQQYNNSNSFYQIVPTPKPSASSINLNYINKTPYKKFLSNWSVTVLEIQLKNDNKKLIVELRGTRLSKDRRRTLNENHFAGLLAFVVSKNLIKTSHGLYELIGPITKASSDNLYRACLEIDGLPRTWKYILTQFPSKINNFNKKMVIRRKYASNCLLQENMTNKYKFIEKLLQITSSKICENRAIKKKEVPLLRMMFERKLMNSLKVSYFNITKKEIPAFNKSFNES